MNYLAHIFLAQPTPESVCGNLLGDFMRGCDLSRLPPAVRQGLENHRLVDRFTDRHVAVQALKPVLSAQRRRFSGIIADVMFDHLLISNWQRFSELDFDVFIEHAHRRIEAGRRYMHSDMQRIVLRMVDENWLQSYATLAGVEQVLERIAHRIRFDNHLGGVIEEIEPRVADYQQAFLRLFPDLVQHVDEAGLEHPSGPYWRDHSPASASAGRG